MKWAPFPHSSGLESAVTESWVWQNNALIYKNPQNKKPLLQYYKTLSILAIFYNALSFKGWEGESWKLKGKIPTDITKEKLSQPYHPNKILNVT